jgi:hypothetical protein
MKICQNSWIILGILSLLYLLENFDRYLISVAIIPYIDYSSIEYSLLVGPVFTVLYAIGGLWFSLALPPDNQKESGSNRANQSYWVLFISTLVFSVSFGATVFCSTFWQQALVRMIMGLAQSVITPFSAAVIREIFPPQYSGAAFAIFNTGTYVAFSMSLSVGVWIYQEYGWKAGYALFGIIGVGVSCFVPLAGYLAHYTQRFDAIGNNRSTYNPLITNDDHDLMSSSKSNVIHYSSHSFESRNTRLSDVHVTPTPTVTSITAATTATATTTNNTRMISNDSSTGRMNSLESLETVMIPTGSQESEEQGLAQDIEDRFHPIHHSYNNHNHICCDSTQCHLFCRRLYHRLYEIIMTHWYHHSGIIILCIATGVRLGGGMVWSAYTGIFYSDLFIKEDHSISCSYSYNATSIASASSLSYSMCTSSAYPYCVENTCHALSPYPWHNQVNIY